MDAEPVSQAEEKAMRKIWTLIGVAAVFTALWVVPAHAHHKPNSYCSPKTGDFCIEARKVDGKRQLSFRSFAHRGRFKLCVRKRSESVSECHRFRLKDPNDDGLYVRNVGWRKYYEYKGKGAYNVKWIKAGARIGPVLGFHA
jgi:hypothetical protein